MILRSQGPGQANACLIFCCDPKKKLYNPAPEKNVAVSLALAVSCHGPLSNTAPIPLLLAISATLPY
jgi:hypothetical protein